MPLSSPSSKTTSKRTNHFPFYYSFSYLRLFIAYAPPHSGRHHRFYRLLRLPALYHPLFQKKKLVSHPGRRRIHKKITPSLGGVAIFLGLTIGCLCWNLYPASTTLFLLIPILIIPFIIGLLDDLIHLKPAAKLIAQALTASLIFFLPDIRLTSFYGLIDISFPLAISYMATLITVVIITNSLNLIDGIDGLAATFSFIACMFFGSWFFFAAEYPSAILCFALAGAILAFLFQNWEPSKIFMGDTGSLVIGTILAVVAIRFINQNYLLEPGHPLKFNSSTGTAICALIIPLVDTTRVILIRLYHRVSLFTPDKRHIHHALVRLGLSHRQSVYILALVHIGFVGLASLLRNTSEWILIIAVISIATVLCVILDQLILRTVKKEPS